VEEPKIGNVKADRFIALEIGETYIRMGIFSSEHSGKLELLDQGSVPIESGSASKMAHEALVATSLKKLLDEKKPSVRKTLLSIEGKSVFFRVVKLPPVAADKLEQTIRHEAVQNIPFPLDEVVWDSFVFDPSVPEPEVLLVAVKADLMDGLVHAVAANGLLVERVDVAPVALTNIVRHLYPEAGEPILLADVESNSSNLVFVEGARAFFRSLSVGANMMPALIGEIGRSITFFQSQADGHAPREVLLAGEEFDAGELQNRLGVPAATLELNPLVKLNAGDTLSGSETVLVGSAVPLVSDSAILIDLMPASVKRARDFRRRQPWWVASGVTALLIGAVWIGGLNYMSNLTREENNEVSTRIQALEEIENQLRSLEDAITELEMSTKVYCDVVEQRTFWIEVLEEIQGSLSDGMFLLSSEPVYDAGVLKGLRIEVLSYLDAEPEGQDVVMLLRDALRESDLFSSETKVFSRPSKKQFARQFVLDVYFEEEP
jgi:Tfp pilus assembly PilM family ATPase